MKFGSIVFIAMMGLLLCLPITGEASSYTFTKIADTDGVFSGFYYAALNNQGMVVFRASLSPGRGGIFIGNGKTLTLIADNSDRIAGFENPPSINNRGTVAFKAFLYGGGEGIFAGNGKTLTTLYDTSGIFASIGIPSINDRGIVAFQAGPDAGGQGLFTGNGGPTTLIASAAGAFLSIRRLLFINKKGTVAFTADLSAGGRGVFTSDGANLKEIALDSAASSSSPFSEFLEIFSFNDKGTVAFTANLETGGQAIFASNGNGIITIADTSGAFNGVGNPSINKKGEVAFVAGLNTGRSGIFTGMDPVADKVITTGDTRFGSRVINLNFFSEGLNDRGQIAFLATFDDDSQGLNQGIYRANPIPEPFSHSDHAGITPIITALATVPEETRLMPTFPSPSNPEVWIPYHLSAESEVFIRIYDLTGRLIRELNLGHQPAGFYDSKAKAAYWDGRNNQNETVASGIYFYTFTAGEFSATQKILITR